MDAHEARTILEEERGRGLEAIAAATTRDELEAAKSSVLGRKTRFAEAQRALGSFDHEDRRVVGMLANEVRDALQSAVEERRSALEDADEHRLLEADGIDVTLPGPPSPPWLAASARRGRATDRRGLHADGVSGGPGPGDRGRLAQLRGPQHPAGPPSSHHEGFALRRRPGQAACGPRHPRRRSGRWRARIRPSTSCPRGASTATRPPTPRTSRSSIRSSASRWTKGSPSPT